MPRGLFELRRDPITGWWVAVVVDRDYDPTRFRRRAKNFGQTGDDCANCRAAGQNANVSVRMLKQQAFTIAEEDAAPAGEGREAQNAEPQGPGLGILGDRGSWQTIVAPRDHHESLPDTSPQIAFELLAQARDALAQAKQRDGTDYLQVVQNWGTQAGARTDHLCLDFYDLPQIPHRIGEELGGAARYVIREGVCPFCRLVREEPTKGRLVYQDSASVCFAPYASRSPFELWVVPRHHDADFSRATDAQLVSAAATLQKVLRLLDVLDAPPYNLLLHTAPLHQRVDDTYHWHWEIHPRLREIAGLELGTGLPVNPVSPEQAVEELLEGADAVPDTSHEPAAARHSQ